MIESGAFCIAGLLFGEYLDGGRWNTRHRKAYHIKNTYIKKCMYQKIHILTKNTYPNKNTYHIKKYIYQKIYIISKNIYHIKKIFLSIAIILLRKLKL